MIILHTDIKIRNVELWSFNKHELGLDNGIRDFRENILDLKNDQKIFLVECHILECSQNKNNKIISHKFMVMI